MTKKEWVIYLISALVLFIIGFLVIAWGINYNATHPIIMP